MKIDVHAHLYPPEYCKELEALGTDSPQDRGWRRIMTEQVAAFPTMTSAEARLAEMDAAGVDIQVLSLSIPNVYFADPGKSLYLAQMANDIYAEVCRKHPDRFMAMAAVPLEFPDLAVEELRRAINRLGMCGLAIGSNVREKPLHSPEFRPVFEEADRLGLPILIHPMVPFGVEHQQDYFLSPTLGYLFDTTMAHYNLVFSGLFERCPNLRMIFPHLGGVAPYVLGRIDNAYHTKAICRQNISRPPSEYFKQFYYDSVNPHVPSMRMAYETFGAERLVLGTDYPFPLDAKCGADPLAMAEVLGLSAAEETMINSGNALRILRRQ